MKKYLLVLAVLTMTGCVHAQYESTYLKEYDAYDCSALKSEMQAARVETKQVSQKIKNSRPKGYQLHTVGSGQITVLGPKPHQEERIRNHARQQVILRLQSTQGCHPTILDAEI